MKARILCVAGARPNFMKLAPLVAALERDRDFSPFIVHTGQHYYDRMSRQFFPDLELPPHKFNLSFGSASLAQLTAEIMIGILPAGFQTGQVTVHRISAV